MERCRLCACAEGFAYYRNTGELSPLQAVEPFGCPDSDEPDQGAFLIYHRDRYPDPNSVPQTSFYSASADFELPNTNINLAGDGEIAYVSLSGFPPVSTGGQNNGGAAFDSGFGYQPDPVPDDGVDQSGWFLTTNRFNGGLTGTPSNRIYRLRSFDASGNMDPSAPVKVHQRTEVDSQGHIKVVATATGNTKWVNPWNPNDVRTELTLGVPWGGDNGTPGYFADDTGDEGLSEYEAYNEAGQLEPVILPPQTVNGLNADGTDNRISLQILLGTPETIPPANGTYVRGIKASNFQINDTAWQPNEEEAVRCPEGKNFYNERWNGNELTVDINVLVSCAPSSSGITFARIEIGPYPQCVGWRSIGAGVCGSGATVNSTTGSLMAASSNSFAAMATQGRYKITLVSPYHVSYETTTDDPNNFSFGRNVTLPSKTFTITATDTVTGARQTIEKTGGNPSTTTPDTIVHFDFSQPTLTTTPDTIDLDSNRSGTLQGFASYQFSGTAGQNINVAINHNVPSQVIFIRVFAPDGSEMATAGNITFGGNESYGETDIRTLPQTGTYTIELRSSTTSPINYTLGLALIQAPTPINQSSVIRSRNLTVLGDHDLFSFDGSLTNALSFNLTHVRTSKLSAMMRIYEADTTGYYGANGQPVTTSGKRSLSVGYLNASNGGQYVLDIRDGYFARYNDVQYTPSVRERSGTYTLAVKSVTLQPVTFNSAIEGNVEGIVAYSFYATAGQTFTMTLTSSQVDVPAFFESNIRSPQRQLVSYTETSSGSTMQRTFTAVKSGNYKIYILRKGYYPFYPPITSLPYSLTVSTTP
jgi:Bacterial pre-peptidase C-terminal domain